jgi:DNA helicase-2/ATP-dependent DNA helicase PcrA
MHDLQGEFERLNAAQKESVRETGNTAVLAGPGSGKTATLVVKAAQLLAEVVPPPQAIACITYNNDAVQEIRNRMAELGLYPGRRLFLGTVHSFCLNCVLRPYAGLIYPRYRDGVNVAVPEEAEALMAAALEKHLPEIRAEYYFPDITRFRRAQFCGEDISGFDDRNTAAVAEYNSLLEKAQLIDFEAMVGLALQLIREFSWIRDLLVARYPWLIVDEYQDLGGPLHAIVTTLIDHAGVKVFAVGDPDQTIYEFTGADPRYLKELAARADFRSIRLKFNYRSGQKLIAAGQAALAPDNPRDYQADPSRKDQGEVYLVHAADEIQNHAVKAVEAVRAAQDSGTKLEQIAIFYRAKHQVLPELISELDKSGIEYLAERSSRYPSSPCIRWLQNLAGYVVKPPEARSGGFVELYRYYRSAAEAAGEIDASGDSLELRTRFYEAFTEQVPPDLLLGDWLRGVDEKLGLRSTADKCGERRDDATALEQLQEATDVAGPLSATTITDFATDGRIEGKAVLTTFHSSKGRQFDVVIIPGLVEGIMPPLRWSPTERRYVEPNEKLLAQIRRLFYVGFTRARYCVHLIYSVGYRNNKGYPVSLGASRFAKEINAKLAEAAGE